MHETPEWRESSSFVRLPVWGFWVHLIRRTSLGCWEGCSHCCCGSQLTERWGGGERGGSTRLLRKQEGGWACLTMLQANKDFQTANFDLLCSGFVQRRLLATQTAWWLCFELFTSTGADMQNVPEEWRDAGAEETLVKRKEDSECTGEEMKDGGRETLMMELTRMVQKMVKESSWWERRGIDCSILAAAFLCLPPGKKLNSAASSSVLMV